VKCSQRAEDVLDTFALPVCLLWLFTFFSVVGGGRLWQYCFYNIRLCVSSGEQNGPFRNQRAKAYVKMTLKSVKSKYMHHQDDT